MALEKMSDFFTARADIYDEHMLQEVEGCKEGYLKMATLIPPHTRDLLDLGCGTGLELDEILKLYPNIHVTGIDLTKAMLEKLKKKHPDKSLTLIHGSYFEYDYPNNAFDTAISFQTMHHFSHEEKIGLYQKACDSLRENGVYIECDYMVESQAEEDFFYQEYARIKKGQGIQENEFYHYDTPCTIENQIAMLKQSGFQEVTFEWRKGNTTIILARK